MKKTLVLCIFAIWSLCALTPPEKKAISQALDYARQAKTDYSKAQQSTIDAWDYATKADARAFETDAKIKPLQDQIDQSHANEANLAKKVDKYEPFYKFGHRWWGIGSIVAGFGILTTHLLILAGFIILLLVAFWALSFVFPALGPIVSTVTGFFSRIRTSLTSRFRK